MSDGDEVTKMASIWAEELRNNANSRENTNH